MAGVSLLLGWCARRVWERVSLPGVRWVASAVLAYHALFGVVLLGERALAYTLLSYGASTMHRRVPWFKLGGQMLHVLPLFLAAQLVVVAVRMAVGGPFPGLGYFLQSVSSTLLWPLADVLLLLPQRRAVNRDENRPI